MNLSLCMSILSYPLYVQCSMLPCRIDYLLISHFLLNLQDISIVTSNGADPSRLSFVRSDQGHVSSIRFANSIIGNLGAPLRDESLGDDDEDGDDTDAGGIEHSDLSGNDEELHVGASTLSSMDVAEENAASPSKISAGPRSIGME